jgi:hypothetical protein
MAIAVERRLDEIFADDLSSDQNNERRTMTIEKDPLNKLHSIILALEWEVSDRHLGDFLSELQRLRRRFKSDRQIGKLVEILYFLGRYIRTYRSDTHPYVFKILIKIYKGLEKLTCGKYTDQEKSIVVTEEIKRYLSLKRFLKTRPTHRNLRLVKKPEPSKPPERPRSNGRVTKTNRAFSDANAAYFKMINKNLSEIKKLLYTELRKLRQELAGTKQAVS